MHFDLVDLRLFLYLAEHKSLTHGAHAASLSPAAASTRLKALENQLNARLFYRDNRGIELTHAGEMLLRHARAVQRQIEHIRNDFIGLSSDTAGHFRIFANTTPITETLPAVLTEFMREHPSVAVDIQERITRDVVRGVTDSTADIGVLSVPRTFDVGQLQSRQFATDRLVLVVPRGHALSARKSVSFEESIDLPHVSLRESTLQSYVLEQAAILNRKLSIRVLMSSYETTCGMIAAGIGVGILPESCARRHMRAGLPLVVVKLSDPWALRKRLVIYRDLDALPLCARVFVDSLVNMQAPAPRRLAATKGAFQKA